MPDPPRDRSHPAPRHSTTPPPIATPSSPAPTPSLQTSSPPTSTSRRSEYFPDRTSASRTIPAPNHASPPPSRAPAALLPRHSHSTSKRARRRLAPCLPRTEPRTDVAAIADDDDCPDAGPGVGDLAAAAAHPSPPPPADRPRAPSRPRALLPDACYDEWIVPAAALLLTPPHTQRNELHADDDNDVDDDGCYEAWFEVCHPNGALAHLYPPLPDASLCAPRRHHVDMPDDGPTENESRINDAIFEAWLAANPRQPSRPTPHGPRQCVGSAAPTHPSAAAPRPPSPVSHPDPTTRRLRSLSPKLAPP